MTTPSREIALSNKTARVLPLERWPEADRNAWNAACQPAMRLQRGGLASHLKPVTREDHVLHYGNFLGFLDRMRHAPGRRTGRRQCDGGQGPRLSRRGEKTRQFGDGPRLDYASCGVLPNTWPPVVTFPG